tara:strand:+ start:60 stop:425 length:366 start_codon:yes stop_codon:yes gene_type:complete
VRFSHQRELIKKVVQSTNSHPTAGWVYDQVKNSVPNISLGTVYRNLKQLTDEGFIKILYDGSVARYDWNLNTHNHLKCTVCGSLIDVHLSNDELNRTVKKKYDFEVSDIKITIIGKCNKHS